MSNNKNNFMAKKTATIGVNSRPSDNSKHVIYKNMKYSFKGNQ